jgi:hypothetical protein
MKTPHDLACAISALINSSPRSPTIAELEGVIGEHWKPETGIPGLETLLSQNVPFFAEKSDALAELVGCVDELRGSEEPLNRELASRLLEVLQDVGVVQKPPMTVVVERATGKSFGWYGGGVTHADGSPLQSHGCWVPLRNSDEPSGDAA